MSMEQRAPLQRRRFSQRAHFPINYIVVVITICLDQLMERLIDTCANGRGLPEIHRSKSGLL